MRSHSRGPFATITDMELLVDGISLVAAFYETERGAEKGLGKVCISGSYVYLALL
jgi:hypothetical protein